MRGEGLRGAFWNAGLQEHLEWKMPAGASRVLDAQRGAGTPRLREGTVARK